MSNSFSKLAPVSFELGRVFLGFFILFVWIYLFMSATHSPPNGDNGWLILLSLAALPAELLLLMGVVCFVLSLLGQGWPRAGDYLFGWFNSIIGVAALGTHFYGYAIGLGFIELTAHHAADGLIHFSYALFLLWSVGFLAYETTCIVASKLP